MEHAPPKRFFPAAADLPLDKRGENYRKDLIKVPSCDLHNGAKSKDDGYARCVVATIAAAYSGAFDGPMDKPHHLPFLQKQIDTINHARGKRLRETFVDSTTHRSGVVGIRIDRDAIDHVIGHTARAAYYNHHEGKKKWLKECRVHSPEFLMPDLKVQPLLLPLMELTKRFESQERYGKHPTVFYYKLVEHEQIIVMLLVFYGCFRFFALSGAFEDAT